MEYQAASSPEPRRIVIKVDCHEQGSNRRAVVTNRDAWTVLPGAVYDDSALRGESENRNRELQCELQADRLSEHRFLANFFGLDLHVTALNLPIRLRRATARPQAAPEQPEVPTLDHLAAESLPDPQRRTFFHRRRDRDPLAEGFACPWRTRLIQAAAKVVVRARRVIVRVSASWPHLAELCRISAITVAIPMLTPPSG